MVWKESVTIDEDPYECFITVDGLISPPPVKPEGTIGLHSVCPSVCLSVCPSH